MTLTLLLLVAALVVFIIDAWISKSLTAVGLALFVGAFIAMRA